MKMHDIFVEMLGEGSLVLGQTVACLLLGFLAAGVLSARVSVE